MEKSGEVYHESVLKDSIIIGFTPRQLELRAKDALNMDENEMWKSCKHEKSEIILYVIFDSYIRCTQLAIKNQDTYSDNSIHSFRSL